MSRLIAAALAAVAIFVSSANARAADWMRLRTANFTLEGDVGAQQLREMAQRLEQFREVVSRALPSAKVVAPAPVTVVVVRYRAELKPMAPRFQGKTVEIDGFASSSPIGPSILVSLERRDSGYSVAYHEYTHLLLANMAIGIPLWLNEGLAEFYGTFQITEDGRRATIGRPVSDDDIGLLRGDLLPLSELLATDERSKLYNVGSERGLFYAQSWLLVHYLMLGSPDRTKQFRDFLGRLGAGTPAGTAFTEAFPHADKLESELSAYVRQNSIRVVGLTFNDRVAGSADLTLTPMTPAEAQARVGFELVRQRRFEEARAPLEWALAHGPETALAHTGMGLSLVLQGRVSEGLGDLQKGAELSDRDAIAHFAYGFGVLQCTMADCSRAQGDKEIARREFQRAVDLQPQFPDALSLLGWTEAAIGHDFVSAERHLTQAIALLPGREDYRFNLAEIYLQQENEAKVQETLGPIAAASPSAENKSKARQMLGALAAMRARRQAAAAAALSAAGTPPPPGSLPPAPGQPAQAEPPHEAAAVAVYRRTEDDERRTDGVLESILCPMRGGIIVTVKDAAGARRFWAPALDAIDFISYRNDLTGRISCGPQAGAMRVYLTSRMPRPGEPALPAGTEGRVLAIEYLPKQK